MAADKSQNWTLFLHDGEAGARLLSAACLSLQHVAAIPQQGWLPQQSYTHVVVAPPPSDVVGYATLSSLALHLINHGCVPGDISYARGMETMWDIFGDQVRLLHLLILSLAKIPGTCASVSCSSR